VVHEAWVGLVNAGTKWLRQRRPGHILTAFANPRWLPSARFGEKTSRMDPKLLYFACILGAAALFLTLRPGPRALRGAGAIFGLGVVVWLLFSAASLLATMGGPLTDASERPGPFFIIFSLIAIASAVRMITHDRPVYSALYFVLVVLSSAALFLLLQAEFMAFALVIVYAGAILITYMFVIMLAQQAPAPDQPGAEADYDVNPREPAIACGVGFVMLAVLANMTYGGVPQLHVANPAVAESIAWENLNLMPREVEAIVHDLEPGAKPVEGAKVEVAADSVAFIMVRRTGETNDTRLALPADRLPGNVQRVGLDLVAKFPVSLELAGVILLMAMFGAVVLARKQIELGEDEVREAAGLRKLALHGDESASPGGAR
jgi:NADH-quinone oxidoreductase subunit J